MRASCSFRKGKENRLVVFAYVPPPEHGQSRMVEAMLQALEQAGARPVHVDARFADGLDGIGSISVGKLARLPGYLMAALRGRFREGGRALYYVPGPVKWSAVLRDWVVLAALRPFFPKVILHWHAVGQGAWSKGDRSLGLPGWRVADWLARRASRLVLRRPHLSISVGEHSTADAEAVGSRHAVVVPNGIEDPCPGFRREVLPWRTEQGNLLQGDPACPLRVLFLAHGTEEKGLLDALEAVGGLCGRLAESGSPRPVRLTLAGGVSPGIEVRFAALRARVEAEAGVRLQIDLLGYVRGTEKARRWMEHHVLLFPSRWESFGLTVVEAMAWGLPVVAAASNGVRGVLGPGDPFLSPAGDVTALAAALSACEAELRQGGMAAWSRRHRARFLRRFRLARSGRMLCSVLEGVFETPHRISLS